MQAIPSNRHVGLDFGTTNSVAAFAPSGEAPQLLPLAGPDGPTDLFRSALCFWHEDGVPGGVAVEAGPSAIHEYLEYPTDSRFLQSFKSVAASASFDTATVFNRRYRFEELGRMFLDKLAAHAGGELDQIDRLVIGRPVHFAGARPDEVLARQRYDAMFSGFAREIHYVYEPLAAAFSYALRLDEPATVLVADFGGGTSDFSVVRVEAPEAAQRCVPLGHAGVGVAGDRFDQRIVDKLVLPHLGKGGKYRSFDKVLDISPGYFADFSDWSKLGLMRNRRTLDELERLRRSAVDPDAIGRMIAMIENELGFPLYEAVGRLKRDLSGSESATFRFSGGGMVIEERVDRAQFVAWIADDVGAMADAVSRALAQAGLAEGGIDRVFLTGGTSLVPAVRALFTQRFGSERIMSGGEMTSIAHGLALVAQQDDPRAWVA
ncbi:putative chaperone protein [Novosphingobium chloroacetimidivorans]|uniref:Putative chaperone protein n=1 Tax=Novosphingobium chloroacetimidivorans TaxID=1428314 RepID=A0A7W7NV84_9SPHN|nr:Hsp70 family protein [Novosphingobium chloroacetimidivorans]MBB4858308.1 putative chaperone protein [Novosphingobium chloroacetimidivorans]